MDKLERNDALQRETMDFRKRFSCCFEKLLLATNSTEAELVKQGNMSGGIVTKLSKPSNYTLDTFYKLCVAFEVDPVIVLMLAYEKEMDSILKEYHFVYDAETDRFGFSEDVVAQLAARVGARRVLEDAKQEKIHRAAEEDA